MLPPAAPVRAMPVVLPWTSWLGPIVAVVIAVPEIPAVVLAVPVTPALTRWMSTPLAKVMPTPPTAMLRMFGLFATGVAGGGGDELGGRDRAGGVDVEAERLTPQPLVGLQDDAAVVGAGGGGGVDADEDDVAGAVEAVGGAAGGQRGERVERAVRAAALPGGWGGGVDVDVPDDGPTTGS